MANRSFIDSHIYTNSSENFPPLLKQYLNLLGAQDNRLSPGEREILDYLTRRWLGERVSIDSLSRRARSILEADLRVLRRGCRS